MKRKYVLYMTRSDSLACNENIVTKQLEKFNRIPTVNNSTRYELVSTIPYSNNSYFIAIIEQEVHKVHSIIVYVDCWVRFYMIKKCPMKRDGKGSRGNFGWWTSFSLYFSLRISCLTCGLNRQPKEGQEGVSRAESKV